MLHDSQRLTRRTLLQTATVTALSALTIGANTDEPAVRPAIGFSLYGMKSLPLAEALSACAEIGYECVELAVMSDWPCDPEKLSNDQRRELKQQLRDRGLQLASLMDNLPLAVEGEIHRQNLDRLKRAVELGHNLDPEHSQLIETVLGGSPDKWPMLRTKFVDRLRDWAAVAIANKSVIAIKPHVAGALHLPKDAAELVRAVDSQVLRLAYDFSHFQLRDLALADSWQEMQEWTRFVHVKDARGKVGAFQFLLPGEGSIDFVELFRLLRASRYAGPVVVEVSGQIHSKAGYDPIAAAKQCWPVLRDAREKAWAT